MEVLVSFLQSRLGLSAYSDKLEDEEDSRVFETYPYLKRVLPLFQQACSKIEAHLSESSIPGIFSIQDTFYKIGEASLTELLTLDVLRPTTTVVNEF